MSALDSLPKLSILELWAFQNVSSKPLATVLHRLCDHQLDHLTLSWQQLHHLVAHQPGAPVPHLQSLSVFLSATNDYAGRLAAHAVGMSLLRCFSSLLRLHVNSAIPYDYFDRPRGDPLSDYASLLNASAPPVFAPRLTHLSIRLYSHDTTAAAAMLPSLPAM